MRGRRKDLPPLEFLVAFEAAARLASFTAAAEELNLTQAAISRQIQDHAPAPALEGRVTFGTGAAATGVMAVGYTVWALRGGALLASMLSAMPVWRLLDPLPVLERPGTTTRKSKRPDNDADQAERRVDAILK